MHFKPANLRRWWKVFITWNYEHKELIIPCHGTVQLTAQRFTRLLNEKMSKKRKVPRARWEPSAGLAAQALPADGPRSQTWGKSGERPSPHDSCVITERMERGSVLASMQKMTYPTCRTMSPLQGQKIPGFVIHFSALVLKSAISKEPWSLLLENGI